MSYDCSNEVIEIGDKRKLSKQWTSLTPNVEGEIKLVIVFYDIWTKLCYSCCCIITENDNNHLIKKGLIHHDSERITIACMKKKKIFNDFILL